VERPINNSATDSHNVSDLYVSKLQDTIVG